MTQTLPYPDSVTQDGDRVIAEYVGAKTARRAYEKAKRLGLEAVYHPNANGCHGMYARLDCTVRCTLADLPKMRPWSVGHSQYVGTVASDCLNPRAELEARGRPIPDGYSLSFRPSHRSPGRLVVTAGYRDEYREWAGQPVRLPLALPAATQTEECVT